MTDAAALEVTQRALMLAIMISAPVLGIGLVVGLVVAVFQAATQINEMTLTFIPKIVAVAAALVLFGPWMLNKLVSFTSGLIQSIPTMVK